jgi:hypothetical protein
VTTSAKKVVEMENHAMNIYWIKKRIGLTGFDKEGRKNN